MFMATRSVIEKCWCDKPGLPEFGSTIGLIGGGASPNREVEVYCCCEGHRDKFNSRADYVASLTNKQGTLRETSEARTGEEAYNSEMGARVGTSHHRAGFR